ncbi:MAG TPA: TetR/AcrR family transcriptional regulator, partial [Negativicutes bacterium]|nr:TetR/AcrR family transcriptional regulator [Negativicutes bacterium]
GKERRMDDVKELILDRAQSRFDRFGFQKTTMDEISRDCKISKRTLYEHFQDKQHLFDCLIEREGHKDLETIFARMGEVPDPLDRLMLLLRTSIAFFSEDIFLTRLLKNDDALFSAMLNGKSHLLITEHLIKIINVIIAEGQEKGRIRMEVNGQVAAYIGFRLFQAFSYMRTIPFDAEKEKQGFYTDALVDFFYNALVKK